MAPSRDKHASADEIDHIVRTIVKRWVADMEQIERKLADLRYKLKPADLHEERRKLLDVAWDLFEAFVSAECKHLDRKSQERVLAAVVRRIEGAGDLPQLEREELARRKLAEAFHVVDECMRTLSPMRWVEYLGPVRDGERQPFLEARDFDDPRDMAAIAALRAFCERHGVWDMVLERRHEEDAERRRWVAQLLPKRSDAEATGLTTEERRQIDKLLGEDQATAHADRSAALKIDDRMRVTERLRNAGASNSDTAAIQGETLDAQKQRKKRSRRKQRSRR